MKITFLGTNGWYSSPTGDTPCILIDSKNRYVVLDAGNGFYKLDQYLKEEKPVSLFISHFHLDHVSGLHTLAKLQIKQGIDIYVGKDRKKDFETLVNPPFTVGFQNTPKLKTKIRLYELGPTPQKIPFKASAIEQFHAYIDHGYRFELEGKTIAYTGDCGFTDQARKLAKDAALLISECSFKKNPDPDLWDHMDPYQASKLARQSNVKMLILNHFAANIYNNLKDRKWAQDQAQKTFKNTKAATDGAEFTL